MIPTNRTEFKQKVLRELGDGVVTINMSDEQIEDVIDSAFQYWSMYHAFGNERTYFKKALTQQEIDQRFVILPDNIISVTRVLNPTGLGGVVSSTSGDNQFSYQYQFGAATMWDLIHFGNSSGYFIANQYLAEMDNLLSQKPVSRYSRYTGKLEFDFDADSALAEGMFLVAEVYAILDPNVYTRIWSDRDLLKLAVAYAKKVWGRILKKYTGFQLPAGMTLSGEALYQEGIDESNEMEARIIRMQAPISFFMA